MLVLACRSHRWELKVTLSGMYGVSDLLSQGKSIEATLVLDCVRSLYRTAATATATAAGEGPPRVRKCRLSVITSSVVIPLYTLLLTIQPLTRHLTIHMVTIQMTFMYFLYLSPHPLTVTNNELTSNNSFRNTYVLTYLFKHPTLPF